MKWRYKFIFFVVIFVMIWFLFGVIYYVIVFIYGDLEFSERILNYIFCIMKVDFFIGVFFFFLEFQIIIGYGVRFITEECFYVIFLLVVQLVITILIEIFITGIFLVKIVRFKKRVEIIKFSYCVVIIKQNGKLCLVIQVVNMRKSFLIQCQFFGKFFQIYVIKEGERIFLN